MLAVLDPQNPESGAIIPSGPLARFREASDKQHVLALAKQLGIAVPAQWVATSPGDTLPQIPDDAFPLVLKPSRSVGESQGRRTKATVVYARDHWSLDAALNRLDPSAFPVLLQQRITGPGIGVFLLRWDGATVATFAHRRIREFPPSGGVSVVCESIGLPEELQRSAEALLEQLDWSGVAMVEFKQDRETGRPFLMEVNPRFWGSLQLAIDAGVDFPWYLVQLALGEKVNPVHTWTIGRRSRWEWGEVDLLLARLRKSRAALDLPADAPGRLKTLAASALFWRPGQRGAVLRLGDPLPFFRESVQWFYALRKFT
jgi:predicted ATP-grasp superfamily ATP-dependent carboligase